MIVGADKHSLLAGFIDVMIILQILLQASIAMLQADQVHQIRIAEDTAIPERLPVDPKDASAVSR